MLTRPKLVPSAVNSKVSTYEIIASVTEFGIAMMAVMNGDVPSSLANIQLTDNPVTVYTILYVITLRSYRLTYSSLMYITSEFRAKKKFLINFRMKQTQLLIQFKFSLFLFTCSINLGR